MSSTTIAVTVPLSPPPESFSKPFPDCDCGRPVAERICQGKGNPENLGRKMYVCADKKCRYFSWKDEVHGSSDDDKNSPSNRHDSGRLTDAIKVKQETEEHSSMEGTQDRKPQPSNLTPPASSEVSARPPRPTAVHRCYCHKIAELFFCQRGRPENVNKWFYRCADEKCGFWNWVESDEDARKRIATRKRKAPDDTPESNCYCGIPAIRLTSKNGMPHNYGREFLMCRRKKCEFWIWADGSLPFSDESQARFDEWADDYW